MKKEKEEVFEVEMRDLVQVDNYRSNYSDSNITDLMRSFKSEGLMQAIGVVNIPGTKKFEIVYGNRRYLAAKKLGWDTIKATLYDTKTAAEKILMNLNENLQREDILAFDEGRGYFLLKKSGLSLDEISVRVGKSTNRIKNTMLCFEKLPPEFRGKVISVATHNRAPKNGKIPSDTASFLLDVKDEYRLTKDEFVKLMDHAGENVVTKTHIHSLAKNIAMGTPIDLALRKSADVREISLKVLMPKKKVLELEKRYAAPIASILLSTLLERREFSIKTRRDIFLRKGKGNKMFKRDEVND